MGTNKVIYLTSARGLCWEVGFKIGLSQAEVNPEIQRTLGLMTTWVAPHSRTKGWQCKVIYSDLLLLILWTGPCYWLSPYPPLGNIHSFISQEENPSCYTNHRHQQLTINTLYHRTRVQFQSLPQHNIQKSGTKWSELAFWTYSIWWSWQINQPFAPFLSHPITSASSSSTLYHDHHFQYRFCYVHSSGCSCSSCHCLIFM